MTETTSIEWAGDAEVRLRERAVELQLWGEYYGYQQLGRRLLFAVFEKIEEISKNVHLHQKRDRDEQVAPVLDGRYVVIYRVIKNRQGQKMKLHLLILDVRRSY